MAKAPEVVIPEAKIRNAIWYLKTGKTKKFTCEFLGISYNVKKLDSIIDNFHKKNEREAELKKLAKDRVFTDKEKEQIAKDYLAGAAQSTLSKEHYISVTKVKNILIEMNVPIRGRGKKTQSKTDHIIQDLDSKFKIDDKVFIPKYNCFGIVKEVFDEDYLEKLENGYQKFIEIWPFKPNPKTGMSGRYYEPKEGVHYEIYWYMENGDYMKLRPMEAKRRKIINNLEETGRETYSIWRDDEQGCYLNFHRNDLFPVRI